MVLGGFRSFHVLVTTLGPLQFQICPNETNRSSVISHQRPKRRRTKNTLAVSLTCNL